MREKLIELIQNADTYDEYECELCTKDDVSCGRCGAEKLADHLLANGVIVPPVRVGQTVWCRYAKPVEQGKVSGITQKANGIFKIRITVSRIRSAFEITADFIGKTVFLTREDAEKALKGGAE